MNFLRNFVENCCIYFVFFEKFLWKETCFRQALWFLYLHVFIFIAFVFTCLCLYSKPIFMTGRPPVNQKVGGSNLTGGETRIVTGLAFSLASNEV